MAKKQLPKAQLGRILKGASKFGKIVSGTVKGATAGYKRAIKVKKPIVKPIETPIKRGRGRPKNITTGKVQEIPEVTVTSKRTSKGNTKSKARLATENVVGQVVGGAPFYTANALKKFLASKYGIAAGVGALSFYGANRWNKTNAPKKAKRFKEK